VKSAACFTGENTDECSFECAVESGVNDWIHNGRRVTEPQKRLEESLVDVARLTDAHDEVDDEERSPARNERRKHHSDHSDGLAFRPHDGPSRVRRHAGVGRSMAYNSWHRRQRQYAR